MDENAIQSMDIIEDNEESTVVEEATTPATNHFKSDGNYIYLLDSFAEFYIPMYYFDTTKRFAVDHNDTIKVLGVFNVGFFTGGKLTEMRTLNLPTMISLYVYDSEVRDVTLSNGETIPCKVVKYLKNAKVMQSMIFQDEENVKQYLKYITGGNLPSIIPYSKALQIWMKNQEMNGVNFGVAPLYLEVILAAEYRKKDDLSKKFASVAETAGDYDYFLASIRQICQYNSTFTALTYEDMDSMITSSLNKSRNKTKEAISPVEQVIKF